MQNVLVQLKKPNSLKKKHLSKEIIKMITLKINLNLYSFSLCSMILVTSSDLWIRA